MILRKLYRFIDKGHVNATWIQGEDCHSVVLFSKDEMLDMTFEQDKAADICYLDKRKSRFGFGLLMNSISCLCLGVVATTFVLAADLFLSLEEPRTVAAIRDKSLPGLVTGVAGGLCNPDIFRDEAAEESFEILSSNGEFVVSFKK